MNVLITGANSGFGLLTTRTLARKGHTVFASMRGVSGKNAAAVAELRAWAEREGVKVHPVELDVTDQASVDHAVKHILETAGHIDVVVNNAGLGATGHTEAFTEEQVQALFNVNVIGPHRVNRAVLPSMRARGKGLLVHISSGLGRFVIPCIGLYGATKFAIEGLAETLRYELALTGVDSVLVQPGAFGTDFHKNSLSPADADRVPGYGDAAKLPEQLSANMAAMLQAGNAPDPQLVADAIAKLVETPAGQRPLRTIVAPIPHMHQAIEACNTASAHVQAGMFAGMGMAPLLQTKA